MLQEWKRLADLPLGYQTKDILFIISSLRFAGEGRVYSQNRLKALPEVEEATYTDKSYQKLGKWHDDSNEKLIGMPSVRGNPTAMILGVRVIDGASSQPMERFGKFEDAKRAYGVSVHKPLG